MPSDAPKLVWLDAEMTGLDLEVDELIEIAAYVTDYELNILDDGIHIVITPSAESLDQMGDFVRTMHTDSGLLDELSEGVSLEEAETS
jgi:Oligoribonuclease (3''->5'' exoribonuclease)